MLCGPEVWHLCSWGTCWGTGRAGRRKGGPGRARFLAGFDVSLFGCGCSAVQSAQQVVARPLYTHPAHHVAVQTSTWWEDDEDKEQSNNWRT